MKILHTVAMYSPSVGGSQEVVKQLSEHLVLQGHDVAVATSKEPSRKKSNINGVKIKEFDIQGNQSVGLTGEVEKYQQYVLNNKFDLILNYAAQSWTTDALIELLPKIQAKKVFAPCGFSGLNHPFYKNYFDEIFTWIKYYDAIVFTSKEYQDYQYISSEVRNKAYVIPNGASENEFMKIPEINYLKKHLDIPPTNQVILNVSSHVYSKNHHELISIFQKLPKKNITLLMIANSFKNQECTETCQDYAARFNRSLLRKYDHKQILIKNLNRADTVRAFFLSDLFFFPSKLECAPLVLYECLAAGLPFISYPAGNVNEIVQISNSGATYRSKIMALYLISKFLHPSSGIKNSAKRGRVIWSKQYSWKSITTQYLSLYTQITNRL